MAKRVITFSLGALGMALVGFVVLFAIQSYNNHNSPTEQLLRQAEELKQRIYADKDGGTTPQETLQLYIAALQKGDLDQAARYYVVPQQEKERRELATYTEKEIKNSIDYVNRGLKGELKIDNGIATFYFITNIKSGYIEIKDKKIPVPDGDTEDTIKLGQNPNKKWKIIHL